MFRTLRTEEVVGEGVGRVYKYIVKRRVKFVINAQVGALGRVRRAR